MKFRMTATPATAPRPPGARYTRRLRSAVLLGVIAGFALPACDRSGTARVAPPANDDRRSTDSRSNVLLISMDTTRADHLACYGHPTIKTPNIDRLAAEGTLFLRCAADVPVTLPSHTSMLTGTYPFAHGVRDNGQFHVHADNLSLAEVLDDAGYATAAEVAAYVLNREFGLAQGFDTYSDVTAARRSGPPGEQAANERKAEEVRAAAGAWLRAHATERFFLFVHFFDPHRTYAPPPEFAAQYRNPYLGEIAYVDAQIGHLLELLDELDLARKTLVILTADHGEGLGEHDEETHGNFLYDATLRVPLILRCPDRIPVGRRVETHVRLIDIAPTVVDFLDLPALPAAHGTSLMSLLAERPSEWRFPAYAETFYPKFSMGCGWYRAWISDGWKYIHAAKPELYDLREDPDELVNLAGAEPERVTQMRAELRELLARARPVTGTAQRALSARDRRALESLGYVASGGENAELQSELELFEPVGPDPKKYVAQSQLKARAVEHLYAGDYARAEQVLRDLLAQTEPEQSPWWTHKTLAEVLRLQGNPEAFEHYHAALQLRPQDGETRANLGFALAAAGRLDEALDAHRRALESPPVFALTHHRYGLALAEKGRLHEALVQQRMAVKLDPDCTEAYAEMGALLARLGRLPEAVHAYELALELSPRDTNVRGAFAELVLAQGRPDKALEQFQLLAELAPESARAHGGLGITYSALGRPDRAIASLRRAVALDPGLAQAWQALGQVLVAQRRYLEALAAYRAGHQAAPQNAEITNALAWILATCPDDAARNGAEALRLARTLEEGSAGADPRVLDTLAAALAEQGRYADAAETIDRALRLPQVAGDREFGPELRQRRDFYLRKAPYRLPTPP